MERSWEMADEQAMDALAAALAPHLADGDAVLLSGDLGAGKTRFVKGVAAALGFAGDVTSPTFNLVQAYEVPGLLLYHLDLYRLEDAGQLEDIGFYETVDAGTPGAALIEWAELFPDDMPDDALEVRISVEGGGRCVRASAAGARAEELLERWAGGQRS